LDGGRVCSGENATKGSAVSAEPELSLSFAPALLVPPQVTPIVERLEPRRIAPASLEVRRIVLEKIPIAPMTAGQVHEHVFGCLDAGKGGWIVTLNVDIARSLCTDGRYAGWAEDADLVLVDGMPLVWAGRLSGYVVPGRIPGADLVVSLSAMAARRGRSVAIVGGFEGAGEAAAQELQRRFPLLEIAGVFEPPMVADANEIDAIALGEKLRAAGADLVYVALGFPKQDVLIRNLRQYAPDAWYVGCGGSVNFLAGRMKRAPVWLQSLGLEWLFRLFVEPRRLVSRYLRHDVPFACKLLAHAAVARMRRRTPRDGLA
jgi:N-acetylglucosaminyldiphosphoundecaprenol N-acetyl-beta-D-mannosaminyltransferase